VQTYRQKYQQKQGGLISWTCNVDFAIPFNATSDADKAAAERRLAFMFGWFYDPLFFGKYPDEMTSAIKDGRLPTFTPEEIQMVKGSFDFIGMNHYTTNYYKDDPTNPGGGWFTDQKNIATPYGPDG
jgi:beta-glucosidase